MRDMLSVFCFTGEVAKPQAAHKQQTVQTKFLQPVGVAAHREMMVIAANVENMVSAEWQEEDHLDVTEQTLPEKDYPAIPDPVHGMCDQLSSSWGNASSEVIP